MVIDYLIVRPEGTVGFAQPDRAARLALGFQKRGVTAAVLTLGDGPEASDQYPVIRPDYRRRVAAGERWDPACARRYGVTNFRYFAYCENCYTQIEYRPRPYDLLMAEVPASFAELDRLFEENEIRHVIHTTIGGEILRQVVSCVAKARGIPVLYESGTRYIPGKTLFVTEVWGALTHRPAQTFRDLSAAKQAEIRAFLESKRTQKAQVTYGHPPRRFFPLLIEFIRRRKFADSARLLKGFQTACRFLEGELSKWLWRPFSPAGNFVFYPIHFTVESNIILPNPSYTDQEPLIRYLARILPAETELVVKQHPTYMYMAGGLSLNELRAVTRMDNVRLVPAQTSTWDILKEASAVVTIYGTAGFEGILLGKPVVVLGSPPYRGWGVTWDARHLDELPALLQDAMGARLSDDRILDFLAAFDSLHLPGDWYDPKEDPVVMADGVIQAFENLRTSR